MERISLVQIKMSVPTIMNYFPDKRTKMVQVCKAYFLIYGGIPKEVLRRENFDKEVLKNPFLETS